MPQYELTIAMEDADGDKTSMGGVVATAAPDPAAFITAMKALQVATPGYTGASVSSPLTITTNVASGGGENERSKKWAVTCKDSTTGRTFTKYVPCANFALATGDKLDISAGVGAAFAGALTALFLSPAGNAFTVLSAKKARS